MQSRKILFILTFIILFSLIGIVLISKSFSGLQPIKNVEIKSETINYDNKDTGAWKITKSAKWVGRAQAQITFDVDSIVRNRKKNTDIIFVLDISASMEGNKLERVQKDTVELLESLLSNMENKAALITFTDNASVISGFTNDKNLLENYVNNLSVGNNTNYYRAFQRVESVLKNYRTESDRECIVLFLTDGWPNRETPNEVGQYDYIKKQYPYVVINGIQYDMGDEIMPQIIRVSDNQYVADTSTLRNTLFEASVVSEEYAKFEISDYIDEKYFYVEDLNSIEVDKGKIDFDNDTQKITWVLDKTSSGKGATMKINIKLKNEYIGQGGVYPTNKKEEIYSKIGEDTENITSGLTPILSDNYKAIYDGNAPDDCEVSNVPLAKNHSVYDTVEVSKNVPVCNGYYFKKWEIVNKNVKKLNDDYYIMPEDNVTLRAIWKKLKVNKSSDGELAAAQTIYDMMADNSVLDDSASEFVGADTGIDFSKISSDTNGKGIYEFSNTKDDKFPVYYYRGEVDNNIKFANICWKIVRTTNTGGVKLIYNGLPDSNGWCNNEKDNSQIATDSYEDIPVGTTSGSIAAGVGYMQGTPYYITTYFEKNSNGSLNTSPSFRYVYANDVEWDGSKYILKDTYLPVSFTTNEKLIIQKYHYTCASATATSCTSVRFLASFSPSNGLNYITLSNGKTVDSIIKEMFSNSKDTKIKSVIDTWYENTLLNYSKYLEDTIWCSDRSIVGGPTLKDNVNHDRFITFGASYRMPSAQVKEGSNPSLVCPNVNDSFTVNGENGNGLLKYPVATITADEANMAGAAYGVNKTYYLFSNSTFYTMSPAMDGCVYYTGGTWNDGGGRVSLFRTSTSSRQGIRPMISLQHGMRIASGNGSVYEPYEVQIN